MPWQDEPSFGPIATPNPIDLGNGLADPDRSVAGAALRLSSPFVAPFYSAEFHDLVENRGVLPPVTPEYRPWDEIQGTQYEEFWENFVGVRDAEGMERMKAQVDQEMEDRATIEAAGAWGIAAEMGASLLSPSTLLPGGALVKGARGVQIAKTGLTVAGTAGLAASLDEAMLHQTQITRTGEESAWVIGGSVLLGGLLGAGLGKLSDVEMKRSSAQVEQFASDFAEYESQVRNLSAAEASTDFTLRSEQIFQAINNIPVLRAAVRSDPILRGQLSPLQSVRKATADLTETILEYRVNEQGQSVRNGDPSVETVIRDRTETEMSGAIENLQMAFGEYWNDGPVSMVGRITAPAQARFAHLVNRTEKLNAAEFMEEVGKAMQRGDKHPIPQVQRAAEDLRRRVYDQIKQEAIDLGVFDEGLQLRNGDSYLNRIYKVNKIKQYLGSGTADDILPVLEREFMARRDQAVEDLKAAGEGAEDELAQFYASKGDDEIKDAALEAAQSIIGLKLGQPSFEATLANPMRARVLDVPDEMLEPWLETNAMTAMHQYFMGMVPRLEMKRKFGSFDMKDQIDAIKAEGVERAAKAKSDKARQKVLEEVKERVRDIEGMRDRLLHKYGVPENPDAAWVQGTRAARSLSFMGYLGNMMLSAIPDVAGMIGRGGIEDAFGAGASIVMDPKRLGVGIRDSHDILAAAEWVLNSRMIAINEIFDPYSAGTKMERIMAPAAQTFGVATGMVPWNAFWKSMGGAIISSRMAKAADAVSKGTASKKQLRILGELNIEPWMAERIAKQLSQFGDKNGRLWLARGQDWTDKEAFDAFRRAMGAEMNRMVVTPGQDKPLFMSTEGGKFFTQFKSFAFSAHHRILLSGIQRADSDVLAHFVTATLLGGLVSNLRADLGGYDRKTGAALWEDALDRSGLGGWLFEPYNAMSAISAGKLSISGEPVSRFQARSVGAGALGPSVDMGLGVIEGISGFAGGKPTYRDARRLMRPIPGNNIWYLMGLFRKIESAVVNATGATPRN